MKPALLLVDLQNDFLDRQGLWPDSATVVSRAAALLQSFRDLHLPVLHVRTVVRSDGADRMPHWVKNDLWICVDGTPGAAPPPELAALEGEEVFTKKFYSGFENPGLQSALAIAGADIVVIAGLYTHACVRATALDAYSHGYEVRIVRDAVATTEPTHAEITLNYLDRLSIRNLAAAEIIAEFREARRDSAEAISTTRFAPLRNPAACDEVLEILSLSGPKDVDRAATMAQAAQQRWKNVPICERVARLAKWAGAIEAEKQTLVDALVRDIGKPVSHAEAEFSYGLDLLRHTITTLKTLAEADRGKSFIVQHAPIGVIGVITPWNNSLAIPLGKLAPALAWGNSVLWKPALPGARIARMLLQIEAAHGLDLPVELLIGDDVCGEMALVHPAVDAITFTGSTKKGSIVAARCAQRRKPLQAELGGNNAVLVMADTDAKHVADQLAPALFGFAGQRCTAPRRIIVEESQRVALELALLDRIASLPLGEPTDPTVEVGPLISRSRQEEMSQIVARREGQILCGGCIPAGFERGAWFAPTLISDPPPNSSVVQEESFGPIAVIMSFCGLEHASALNNSVSHGLVTTVFSEDRRRLRKLMAESRTGIVVANLARPPIAADAPFGGWKSSGNGPPEHGRWDREFYARPQVFYPATALDE